MRYEKRWYSDVRSKAYMSQIILQDGTTTYRGEQKEYKVKTYMLRSIGKQSRNLWSHSERKKVGYGGKDLQKRKVLSLEWKNEGVMDDESCESMELIEEVPLKELREAELQRLVRGWQREAKSRCQRRREAYWKEQSFIRREDDVDERANVTKVEKQVLQGGWTVMRLCRYEGWVVVRTL